MFRIEVHDPKSDRWNPAFMAIVGTNLMPERASTFETPEVAFERCAQLAKLRPEATYRVVDAALGVVIWTADHKEQIEHFSEFLSRAVYLNGDPAEPVETGRLTRYPPTRQQTYRPADPDILIQIIASQEEFITGIAELRGAIDYIKSVHPGGCARALRLLEAADNAAQEILTNLRALAKPADS